MRAAASAGGRACGRGSSVEGEQERREWRCGLAGAGAAHGGPLLTLTEWLPRLPNVPPCLPGSETVRAHWLRGGAPPTAPARSLGAGSGPH